MTLLNRAPLSERGENAELVPTHIRVDIMSSVEIQLDS